MKQRRKVKASDLGRSGLVLIFFVLVRAPAAPQTPSDAQQLQAQGDWKGAEDVWRKLLKQDSGDYRIWASLGIVLSQEHRYQDAVAAYRKALALEPQDGQTELNLGIAYFKMGRLSDAIKPLQAASKSLGKTSQLDVLLGLSLYGTGSYRAAAPYLERAYAAEPGNVQLELTLGEVYMHSGAYDEAMAAFRRLLTDSADSAQAHMLLGQAYDAANRETEAIAEFRAATKGPYLPDAHFGLGYLYWKARNYAEAEAELQKELEHDPRNSQALVYLGDIALQRNNPANASDLLRQSIALRPDSHLAFVDLAIIETGNKQYELAEKHLERAVTLQPNEADAHYRLARLYQLTGRPVKAENEFALVKQIHHRNTDDLVFKVSKGAELTVPDPGKPKGYQH